MNQIIAEIDQSDYEGYSDFLNIKIDCEWLDEKLESLYPGEMYKGTIPTLLFAMEIEAESKVVWKRILPDLNCKTICPVLMCPDDNDFSCTLIMAEIENTEQVIIWYRLGLDITKSWEPEKIGSEVKWFDKVSPYHFYKSDYLEMVKSFEQQRIVDKADWIERNKKWLEGEKNKKVSSGSEK